MNIEMRLFIQLRRVSAFLVCDMCVTFVLEYVYVRRCTRYSPPHGWYFNQMNPMKLIKPIIKPIIPTYVKVLPPPPHFHPGTVLNL